MPVVIKMKGLPFEATAKDIQMFFHGLNLREQDIHLAAYKDGKASGIGFAMFPIDDDARKAMYRTGKYIGKRYIELFLSSVSEMEAMLYNGVPEPKVKGMREALENAPGLTTRDELMGRRERSRSPISRPEGFGMQNNRRRDPQSLVTTTRGGFGNGFDKRRGRGRGFISMPRSAEQQYNRNDVSSLMLMGSQSAEGERSRDKSPPSGRGRGRGFNAMPRSAEQQYNRKDVTSMMLMENQSAEGERSRDKSPPSGDRGPRPKFGNGFDKRRGRGRGFNAMPRSAEQQYNRNDVTSMMLMGSQSAEGERSRDKSPPSGDRGPRPNVGNGFDKRHGRGRGFNAMPRSAEQQYNRKDVPSLMLMGSQSAEGERSRDRSPPRRDRGSRPKDRSLAESKVKNSRGEGGFGRGQWEDTLVESHGRGPEFGLQGLPIARGGFGNNLVERHGREKGLDTVTGSVQQLYSGNSFPLLTMENQSEKVERFQDRSYFGRNRSPPRKDRSPPKRDRSPHSRDRGFGESKARNSRSEGGFRKEKQEEQSDRRGHPREKQQEQIEAEDNDSKENSTCVRLFGLPWEATRDDILQFFRGLRIANVEILQHYKGKNKGKNTGAAYAVFKSIRDATEAMKMHQKYLGTRYIELRRVSKDEMVKEIEMQEMDREAATTQRGSPEDRPARSERGHASSSSQYEDKRPSSSGGHYRDERRSSAGGNRHEKEGRNSGRRRDEREHIDERFRAELESSSSAGHFPISNLGLNPQDLTADVQDIRYQLANAMLPNAGMDVNQALETLSALAMTANINAEDIRSGCVIGIRNLPSSITAEEILDFFYGFSILPDSIRIHYLSPGRSSGDAMISFASSAEAFAAIEQLNFKPVGKKKIQLFLV